ncbi:MAG: hydroxymethylbilane synthase [Gammaproteobacteria bacterium]|uniref:Hydroxymethylbilane synthase n=1 Tax=SAR86 cluster bacterium TaxID=2030880 RepID=A0A520MWK9_9GAMM|nr:hydroxymethylbilane synthase [SAR86 cluster bacterium]RZO25601.1 MAG: hydroxymethylbilane synthase [SAR86 cluster bacterium]|tara:strand:+ start:3465 stop:4349 length:885 start_codon:yes stop_codon:yes gene_type:complete
MKIKIGSRSSKLALKQVEIAVNEMGIKDYEIVKIKTQGDLKSSEGRTQFDKLNFVEEIENLLFNEEIDLAVHSAKDMPAKDNPSLKNCYIIENSSITYYDSWFKDLLIFRDGSEKKFEKSMKLGTSSLRRKMQAKYYLNALNIHDLNGNIDTRINKLESGDYDCIILANAGCKRLKYNLNAVELDHYTSPGQGMICIQSKGTSSYLEELDLKHKRNKIMMDLQKKFLIEVGADCNSSIALNVELQTSFEDVTLNVEVYGKNKKIKFSGYGKDCLQDALAKFHLMKGGLLLNEHN